MHTDSCILLSRESNIKSDENKVSTKLWLAWNAFVPTFIILPDETVFGTLLLHISF